MTTFTLNLDLIAQLTDEQFYQLCQANRDLKFERNANGELIIVSPVGGEGGSQEAELITDLALWNRQTRLGKVFSSSTIFRLPNGADRSPDAAWVSLERWQALTLEEQERFPPLCPDFVIELRSRTDNRSDIRRSLSRAAERFRRASPSRRSRRSLRQLQNKMQEYLDNGLRLGWLIDPQSQHVEVYRSQQAVEIVKLPATLSGEDRLPGFELALP